MKTNLKTGLGLVIAVVIIAAGCKKESTGNPGTTQVIPLQTTIQAPVELQSTSTIAIIAGAAITSTGQTVINGDIALSPGTSVGGFPPGIINGTLRINDNIAVQSKLDLVAIYDNLKDRLATDMVTISGNIGGLTLTPGLYKSTSSLAISTGDVTFDAKGNADAIFIIQVASSFTTTSGRQVFLAGGAQAKNIFWQISSSASIGTTSAMKGNIIALESITFKTGATLDGRALARNGSVTLEGNVIGY